MAAFKTYEYHLDLSKTQKKEITELMDEKDHDFNMLALTVNQSYLNGADIDAINAEIDAGLSGAVYDGALRKELQTLALKQQNGILAAISPRSVYRNHRSFKFAPVWVLGQNVLIPGIGWANMVMHRPLPPAAKICFACLTEAECRSDYKISFCLMFQPPEQALCEIPVRSTIGLDYKQDGLYVDSRGRSGNYPGFWQNGRKKVAALNQIASRFHVGSRRWMIFRKRAAKAAAHIDRQRKDWQFKKAAELAAENDAVCVEHLDFKAMQEENAALAPKLRDNNWLGFRSKLECKLSEQGKPLIEIPRYFPSSQICCSCGYRFGRMPLSTSTITCPNCGRSFDRDVNAACNIRDEGLRLLKAS